MIEDNFKRTLPKANIVLVERIQNRRLWTVFSAEVQLLKEKYQGQDPEIRYLYHGTSNTSPYLIYKSEEGFDMKYSPGGMWGKANYFAVNSGYSHDFRYKHPNGTF